MIPTVPVIDSTKEITDRIANALPVDLRAAFYRELTYCDSLPENDEILRILRVMQFLTLLMYQVPERVLAERERLERLFRSALDRLQQIVETGEALHRLLEQRLAGLPTEVARGLSPPAIAREINESLRQQFVKSTIPETATALAVVAGELRRVSGEFGQSARAIGDAHRGAASEARRAIDDLASSVSRAAETARGAAMELSTAFQREFRWSLYALSGLALVIGIVLGMLLHQWIDVPLPTRSDAEGRPAQMATPQPKTRSR